MSQSPTPSATSNNTGGSGAGGGDWRSEVQQSARNKQVREIANVLASLEPGASSTSKLRLAMQFEDTVFKGADSLADYQKKLTKRLKKLQKNYVPTQPAGATEKVRTIESLRQTHGESIRYVLKHAEKAIQEMKAKDEEKGRKLEQHLETANIWAQDLGLLENSKPNYNIADDQLERLKTSIGRYLDNIRAHVVKLADPDRFFVETLDKAEDDCRENAAAAQFLSKEVQRRYLQLLKTNLNPVETMTQAMEQVHKPVPLLTRSQTNDNKKAALVHFEKMRAASTALLAFMAMPDKTSIPKGTLKKLHANATEGIDFVTKIVKEHRKTTREPQVSLQDAWIKHLEWNPTANIEGGSISTPDASVERPTKRARRLAFRSRILLTANRKAPPNLLVEFQRKGAKLVRPPYGQGSCLQLDFETAFSMNIYLVPLQVEIRAYRHSPDLSPAHSKIGNTSDNKLDNADSEQNHQPLYQSFPTAAPWTPLYSGLLEDKDKRDPSKSNNDKKSSTTNSALQDENHLTVWTVKGNYETVGHIVEERLRDASAHATLILRQCFAHHTTGAHIHASSDFEMEILEGQAMRDFLELVRKTYMPNWKDVDVVV